MWTLDRILALMTLIAVDHPMSALQIGEAISDFARKNRQAYYEYGYATLGPLVAQGAVAKPFSDFYVPTEKGRIAAALLMAKDPGLRAAFFDE